MKKSHAVHNCPSFECRGQQSDQENDQWESFRARCHPCRGVQDGRRSHPKSASKSVPDHVDPGASTTRIHIYKQKGNRQSCDNQRGISLLSTAAKILYRVLLNLNDCWSKVSSPLRANAASAQVVEQPTRYLSPASSRIRLPERGLPYSQSGRTLENHGNIRVTKHVHRNRPPIP